MNVEGPNSRGVQPPSNEVPSNQGQEDNKVEKPYSQPTQKAQAAWQAVLKRFKDTIDNLNPNK